MFCVHLKIIMNKKQQKISDQKDKMIQYACNLHAPRESSVCVYICLNLSNRG